MDKTRIISDYIESEEMQHHLIENVEILTERQLANIICGGRKHLSKKCKDLRMLANTTNDEYIQEAYMEAEEAIADLKLNVSEIFLITERGYDTDIAGERIYGSVPALSLKQVSAVVKDDMAECTDEENQSRTDWYELEKYVSDNSDNLEWKSVYTIAPNNEIGFYHNLKSKPFHRHFNSGANLYLPIPFEIGDILTIDCRPFRPVKQAVLIEKGIDCCSTTCAWISGKGNFVRVGALMHNSLFDDPPIQMSALYRLEKYKDKPEEILSLISDFVKHNAKRGNDLWRLLSRKKDITFSEAVEWIKQYDVPKFSHYVL